MTARCPCGSRFIGFPVPPDALAVREDGALSAITLANHEGKFLYLRDLDHAKARCLDCGQAFDATEQIARKPARALHSVTMSHTHQMEWSCDEHGWEPFHSCADCLSPICAVQAVRSAGSHDAHLCADCLKARGQEPDSHQESHG